jgi:hypothetical protein
MDTLDPMDQVTHIRDHGAMAEAIDELMAALNEPHLFPALVDIVEPAPLKNLLALWGIQHRV